MTTFQCIVTTLLTSLLIVTLSNARSIDNLKTEVLKNTINIIRIAPPHLIPTIETSLNLTKETKND